MFISFSDIHIEQSKPLEYKIAKALDAIAYGFALSKHKQSIAFSGGKDSTVLWHLIRTYFPNETPYVIFGNTGVEFPESLQFARQLGRDWGGEMFRETELQRTEKDGLKYKAQRETLEWLVSNGEVSKVLKKDGKLKSTDALERAATSEMWDDFRERDLVWKAGSLMSYWWCADQYGFPLMGKAASKLDARRINIDCFLRFSKSASDSEQLAEYYDVLRECRISQHCCKLLKKEPSEKLQKELCVDVIFKGLMASESKSRLTNFSTRGYIFKSKRKYLGADPFFHVNPLSIWTDDDIWEYIKRYNVPYSKLYEIQYTDSKGRKTNMKRNGCVGCGTDILYKDNHLAALRKTHPSRYDGLMRYGMGDVLKALMIAKPKAKTFDYIDRDDPQMNLFDAPCAFDDVDSMAVVGNAFRGEYDPEYA